MEIEQQLIYSEKGGGNITSASNMTGSSMKSNLHLLQMQ
jgi:hypothetical protein